MAKRGEAEHLVIFPFMAQGHILPFLSLALHIEQRLGFIVTFVNTPLNIKTLRPSLPPNSTINLVSLPFSSSDHGLPPDSENTNILPYPLLCRFLHASRSLKPSFHHLISQLTHTHGQPPLCIISDMFFGWTIDVARDLGIPHAVFNAGGAYGMAVYFSLWLNLPHLRSTSNEFSLPDFPEVSKIHLTQLSAILRGANGTDPWSTFLQKQLNLSLKSDAILFNSVEALDQTGSKYFRRKFGGSLWTIGPIRTTLVQERGRNQDFCIEWLNTHEPTSVLYISFGSQNTISASQMMQLAMGLEASGKNFIWVVRPPIGFDINSEFRADWLPERFEDRMREINRGLLVRKWAPQMEILSHRSTSAFLSHCGWNSVMESLSHGVPIIGWPMGAEQFYNCKLLEEEVGVCVEVARGFQCEIRHEHVKEVIELAMSDSGESKRGKEMRRRACEVKEILKDAIRDEEGYKGSSVKAMDEFFDMVLSMKRKTTSIGNGKV